MRAVEELQEFGRQSGVSEKELFGLALTLEECASNIVRHALQCDARKTFSIEFEYLNASFVVELRDRGPMFNPTTTATQPPQEDNGEGDVGGWGLQLVRRYTDEMIYTRENDENILRLIKRLGERTT
jgi:anti-sigma regulatory factor (Ser/Thr protein kinase)